MQIQWLNLGSVSCLKDTHVASVTKKFSRNIILWALGKGVRPQRYVTSDFVFSLKCSIRSLWECLKIFRPPYFSLHLSERAPFIPTLEKEELPGFVQREFTGSLLAEAALITVFCGQPTQRPFVVWYSLVVSERPISYTSINQNTELQIHINRLRILICKNLYFFKEKKSNYCIE